MSQVVSLTGYRPVARYDGEPWTTARLEASSSADGPWDLASTVTLAPPDADPSAPASRSFTFDAPDGATHVRVVFVDADGARSATEGVSLAPGPAGGSVRAMPPTADDVRRRSRYLADRYPANDDDGPLDVVVEDAVAIVQSLTCRTLDESLPASLWTVAARAVALKAQRMAHEGDAEVIASALEDQNLRSINAGPWGETYFGPGEAASAKVLDRDPATHEALWALATDECRDEWRRTWGQAVPHRPASVLATPAFGRGWMT